MREHSAGDDAVLLDFSGDADPAASAASAARRLRAAASAGEFAVCDVIATAAAVLVQAEPGRGIDALGVRRALSAVGSATGEAVETELVDVPVTYDGADLDEVAGLAGVSPAEVIAAHCAVEWRVQFMGFAPGFGYLVPSPDSPDSARAVFADLTRRAQSRTAVPAGSVAVAAGYSAIYPRRSPGGWFLLGHTEIPLWNVEADPPAALSAGSVVRFRCEA